MKYDLHKMAMIGIAGFGVVALGACDDDDPVGVDTRLEYSGVFTALNGSGVAGVADIDVDDVENDFNVSIEAGGLDASITHAQHIHAAGVCPTMADDVNSDGFLDVIEGLPMYGGILIPLDTDLSDQEAGDFPSANADGDIDFTQASTFTEVDASVRGTDEDIYVELESDALLAPQTRTVVLHGVLESTELPGTVQSLADLPATATLPVACAELELQPG